MCIAHKGTKRGSKANKRIHSETSERRSMTKRRGSGMGEGEGEAAVYTCSGVDVDDDDEGKGKDREREPLPPTHTQRQRERRGLLRLRRLLSGLSLSYSDG